MKFTEKQIDSLRVAVGKRLSLKRLQHTLCVEKMALKIGALCLPDSLDLISVAALLHDISKEYSEAEQYSLMKRREIALTPEEIAAPPIWHSLTAPTLIKEEFSQFAEDEILSAVYNHTIGAPDMSLLDEIIFLADYIEDGRTYKSCIDVRDSFLRDLNLAQSGDECVLAVHIATAQTLQNNINELTSRGLNPHSRTVATLDAVREKIERHNNGKY